MQRFLEYSVNYTNASLQQLANRQQQYDRRSQIFSIVCTPRVGHHVPFLVKFPSYTRWFSKLPNYRYFNKYRNGSPGVFNGLYYFPDGTSRDNEFEVPDVVSVNGQLNLTKKFQKSAKYDLLKYIGQRVIDNIDIGKHSYIQLKLEPAEFRNSSELLKKSKFLSL